jgi:hypothetical protein
MKFPTRTLRSAMDAADHERSIGIPDREPVSDDREVIPMDLRTHGGKNWQIEPRLGYTSCRLRDMGTGAVDYCGTMKQCLREVSRVLAHRLGGRNLQ